MSGWGSGGWGSGGGGLGMHFTAAYAVSERQVRVKLNAQPMALSTIATGDALNPKTWTLVRNDTGESLIPMAVGVIDAYTVEIYLLKKLPPFLVLETVAAVGLLDASGASVISPYSAVINGCIRAPIAQVPDGMVDFANIPISEDQIGGVLTVGSSGDYETQSGDDFLRKLVFRRLTVAPNEFFYLAEYGLGLRIKEPFFTQDLAKLQAAAQLQLLQEPEFATVRVRVTLTSDDVLYLHVTVTLRATNRQVKLSIPAQVNLVTF